MWRLSRFANRASTARTAILSSNNKRFSNVDSFSISPFPNPSQSTSIRFLDFYQMGNKDAIEKERARLYHSKDEMSRGYFADMSDLKKHGGKIAMATETLIPAAVAVKFPTLEVSYSDGKNFKLPFGSDGNVVETTKMDLPKATLLCLSFRASSQRILANSL
ncbi:Valine--tRNA ligase [Bienertia sinuspersici]